MKIIIALHILICSYQVAAEIDIPVTYKTIDEKIDRLWFEFHNQELDPVLLFSELSTIDIESLSISNQVKLQYLKNNFSPAKHRKMIEVENLELSDAYFLAAHKELLGKNDFTVSHEKVEKQLSEVGDYIQMISNDSVISDKDMNELFHDTPDGAHYRNGYYKDSVRLFLLCRKNRNYPCLFVMKDIFDNFVREDQEVWAMPALAKSAKNIPSYQTNGHTPVGIHSLDSVMPDANRPTAFGKFRRVILNWIPKLAGENGTKSFLPKSQFQVNWWKAASIARDAGRKYLRIHGTGKLNTNTKLSYYPHVPTSGCISTREGKYPRREYTDQRIILDKLMDASQLMPTYSNEKKIKGILYVVNIDDQRKPVTKADLKKYGVE